MVSKAHFPKFRVSAHPGQQQSVLAVVFHSIHAAAIRCKQLPGRGNYRAREYWFQMHRSDIAREACLGGYAKRRQKMDLGVNRTLSRWIRRRDVHLLFRRRRSMRVIYLLLLLLLPYGFFMWRRQRWAEILRRQHDSSRNEWDILYHRSLPTTPSLHIRHNARPIVIFTSGLQR